MCTHRRSKLVSTLLCRELSDKYDGVLTAWPVESTVILPKAMCFTKGMATHAHGLPTARTSPGEGQ